MAAAGSNGNQPRQVSPDLYTRDYFTTDCEGYDLFLQGVRELPERIEEALGAAGDLSGKWVLDIGCGRGELLCEAAARGAHAAGIDYSEAAIALSRERLSTMEEDARERVELVKADAKGLPFPGGSFDVVFMVDVYEHLHPHEIQYTLGEIERVLRPEGLLIVHTGPNTWFYRYGYPLVRAAAHLLLRRELPENLRGQYDDVMHVNEQSPLTLYRTLKDVGFDAAVRPRSFFTGIDPSRWKKAVMRILFARPTSYFFCTSLMATATPRKGGREAQLRVNRMLRMINPPRGSGVLLVGEIEGLLARRLSGLAGVEVTWLEPGGEAAAAPAVPSLQCGGYDRLRGDAGSLPFPDAHFDAVAAQFTLDHLENPARALSEWSRVLKDGGTLALVVKNGLFRGREQRPGPRPRSIFTPRRLRELVGGAGLKVTGTSTLIPDLKLPLLYRGDLDFALRLERYPCFTNKGKLLFLRAVKERRGYGGE